MTPTNDTPSDASPRGVTLGTKVFHRTAKLLQLLHSVPDGVSRVIVANDGDADLEHITTTDWTFDLTVIDLEYDAGLGAGRQAIVDALDTEYLLITDTDHELPENVLALRDVLDADPTIGGVAGFIDEGDGPRGLCHDLREQNNVLVRDLNPGKTSEEIAGHTFIEFEFVPNAALFRASALDEYGWDPEYVIGREHLDFYVGHWHQTDWRFGVCPSVVFPHYPGGSDSYSWHRHNFDKLDASRRYFLDKWGYEVVLHVDDYVGHGQGDGALHPLPTPRGLPLSVQARLKQAKRSLGRVMHR